MSLLENIRLFMAVVEVGSMSGAGRRHRVSPAVVSHRMMQLEQHLGVRLLNRTTRKVQVTEHGRIFYESSTDVIAALDAAEASVSEAGTRPSGNLRVTAPLSFGRRFLPRMIAGFRSIYPEVAVRLRLSDHLLDLLGEGVDLAIRLGNLEDSSLIQRKIADCERILCASPDYLDRHGVPGDPDELMQHQCLLLRFPGSRQFRWTLQTAEGPRTLPVQGALDADDGDTLTEWALLGLGIVLKPVFEVAEHLQNGRLVPILPDLPPEPVTLAVLCPHRHLLPAKVRVFADYVVEHGPPWIDRTAAEERAMIGQSPSGEELS
ncbi:MAG: LysR family transcriptional regulator [Geminicoccaceae bacterium]|nr:LysR family transcriptional regulator [Geminicoccaceae bacterium]